MFWESIKDSPALRCQLIELVSACNWQELAELWGFDHHEQLSRYIRGPLRNRLEKEAGGEALEYLMQALGDRAL